MEPGDTTKPLRDLARAAFRHHRKMAIFFLATIAATLLITLISPRSFRSQAKLFARLGRENATLDPTATFSQSPVVAVPQSRENELNTAAEVLKSRVLLEKVVDALGPQAILNGRVAPPTDSGTPPADADPHRYEAILKLTRMVDVEAVKKSNVLAVTYDGPTAESAQLVVAKLLEFFLDRHMQLNRAPRAHQFLVEQTARQRAELNHSEEELRDYKNATGMIAPDVQRQLLVTRMSRQEDELLQTNATLAGAEAEVRLLREKLAGLSPTHVVSRTRGMRNEAADNMRGQLYTLQLRELELRQKYPDGHPELERVRQQASAAREILRQEEHDREQLTEGPSRLYEETELAVLRQEPVLTALRAKADALRAQLDQQRAEFKTFNENSLRIARLERDLGLQESHYRRYAENLEQAQIDRALEAERISNISVVQPATLEANPVRPRWLVNLGIGVLLAVVGSLVLAYVVERLDPTVKCAAEIESVVGLPVLAAAPRLESFAPARNGTEAIR
jgi:uncharacterized protein involved in exopolysaccharide biosynthesis